MSGQEEDRLLGLARLLPLLAVATPANAIEEHARLLEAADRGGDVQPRWRYRGIEGVSVRSVLRELEGLDAVFSRRQSPLSSLYAERAKELVLEARLCERVGTPDFGKLAAQRFAPFADESARAADDLADAWLGAVERDDKDDDSIASDDAHPSSLLSRLRREVETRRLPFSVMVQPRLFALAATGQKTILVAAGRRISEEAARRTVLHEIEGHVMPRVRAARHNVPLLSVGSARGIDEQEGYALALEDRHDFLSPVRRRELAARYVSVRAMRRGGSFSDVFRLLTREYGVPSRDAIGICERAFRGGSGQTPGLGRECVYLESYVRVRDHLALAPADEEVLASGQLALSTIDTLRPRIRSAT